jgi:hypothetical protein
MAFQSKQSLSSYSKIEPIVHVPSVLSLDIPKNEIVDLTITTPISSSYIIYGQSQINIPPNVDANTLETNLEENFNIGESNIQVTGTSPTFQLEFKNLLGGKALPLSLSTDISGNSTLVQTQAGAEGETYTFTVSGSESIVSVISSSGQDITNDGDISIGRQESTLSVQNVSSTVLSVSASKIIEWRNKS